MQGTVRKVGHTVLVHGKEHFHMERRCLLSCGVLTETLCVMPAVLQSSRVQTVTHIHMSLLFAGFHLVLCSGAVTGSVALPRSVERAGRIEEHFAWNVRPSYVRWS